VGLVVNEQVEQFQERAHFEDIDQALTLLRSSNASTRIAMMIGLCGQLTLNPSGISSENMDRISRAAIGLEIGGSWPTTFLHLALRAGNAPLAMILISQKGNPHKVPEEGGSDPVGRLAYGDYENLSVQDTIDLLGKIEAFGGDFYRVNPGGVKSLEVLKFLIDRWPRPKNILAWRDAGFVFDLDDAINQQSGSPQSVEKIQVMLDAGFPFDPLAALASSLFSGCYDNASYLLSIISDEQLRGEVENDEGDRTIWHVVASTWASRRRGQLTLGWTEPEVWPPQEIIDRLLVVELLERGEPPQSPNSLAISICGEEGPLAGVASEQMAKELREASHAPKYPTQPPRSRRL
jgi:hypothetical protein